MFILVKLWQHKSQVIIENERSKLHDKSKIGSLSQNQEPVSSSIHLHLAKVPFVSVQHTLSS